MAASPKTLTVRQFFGRKGLLSEWHPGYEYREGQLQMAEAVESALADKKHLIVEAGTGTGKTLAYLVPAILSGKRVVISTGTKNLQEQLFFKDIPFLEKHLGPLRACYMKGRANYACRQKIYDAEKEPVLAGLEEVADFQIIQAWEKTTETGDRAEIKSLPEHSPAWAKMDARGELCSGQKCPQFERCFITRMHQKASESDLIIVNHHLFFADLAVKEDERGAIIPDYAAVIFDEAHEVEDVAGQYFGVSISSGQVEDLTRDVAGLAHRKQFGSEELDRILITVTEKAAQFFALFGNAAEGRTGFRAHEAFLEKNEEAYRDVLRALELVTLQLELVKAPPDEALPLVARAREMARKLQFWMEGSNGENSGQALRVLDRAPRAAGLFCRRRLSKFRNCWTNVCSIVSTCAILTSATLAVAGSFEYTLRRLGLRAARTELVPSHFDHKKQALLYVPQNSARPAQSGIRSRRGEGDRRDPHAQPGAGVRALHQLPADAPDLRPRVARNPVSDAAAGNGAAERAARRIPRHAQRGAVRDLIVLAGRGRAGRTVELRYYR